MEDQYFNIEEYINSLPDDIEVIDIGYHNLTYIPDLSRFKKLNYLDCSYNNLVYLPNLPNNLTHLNCCNNKLVILPNLPNSLIELYCGYNQLIKLPNLPNSLKQLYSNYNKLTYLPNLPNSLIDLSCNNNQLIYLPNLPNSLIALNCNNTIINEIINVKKKHYFYKNEQNKFNNKLYIYNKFRELYFALKFKKQFYKLYERIVIKRYHPSNLIKLLENVGDDEEKIDLLLESW
jgi:Leucine-rich repeat (LRR) protein